MKLKDLIAWIVWQPQTSWPVHTLRSSQRSVAANAEHGRLAPILHAYFAVQTHALRRTIATARAGGGAEAVTAEEILHLHGSDVHMSTSLRHGQLASKGRARPKSKRRNAWAVDKRERTEQSPSRDG